MTTPQGQPWRQGEIFAVDNDFVWIRLEATTAEGEQGFRAARTVLPQDVPPIVGTMCDVLHGSEIRALAR